MMPAAWDGTETMRMMETTMQVHERPEERKMAMLLPSESFKRRVLEVVVLLFVRCPPFFRTCSTHEAIVVQSLVIARQTNVTVFLHDYH